VSAVSFLASSSPPVPNLLRRDWVRAAIKAPSSHNTQPWLFRIGADRVSLLADRTRALPVNDPEDRELTISCGAALFTLRIAVSASGYAARTELLPDDLDPDLLAELWIGDARPAPPDDAALAAAIDLRRTCRKPFLDRPIEPAIVGAMRQAAALEGATLVTIDNFEVRLALASLVGEGDRMQFSDPRWRRELAAWMHPRRAGDGLTMPDFALPLARMVVSAFDLGSRTGASDQELASSAPLLAVVTTDRDEPEAWLRAGQALQRVLLVAARHGVQAGHLNQPCQLPDLRPRLRRLLAAPQEPQIVLRLGFPAQPPDQSARRPLDAVLET
jgi:hypothetical protein